MFSLTCIDRFLRASEEVLQTIKEFYIGFQGSAP